MRKFISLVVMATMLAGCNMHLNGRDVEAATEYCADKGGVYSINLTMDDTVKCVRDSRTRLLRVVRAELGASSTEVQPQ